MIFHIHFFLFKFGLFQWYLTFYSIHCLWNNFGSTCAENYLMLIPFNKERITLRLLEYFDRPTIFSNHTALIFKKKHRLTLNIQPRVRLSWLTTLSDVRMIQISMKKRLGKNSLRAVFKDWGIYEINDDFDAKIKQRQSKFEVNLIFNQKYLGNYPARLWYEAQWNRIVFSYNVSVKCRLQWIIPYQIIWCTETNERFRRKQTR